VLLDDLREKKILRPCPSFVVDNCVYLTLVGSVSYGCADTNKEEGQSDYDLLGVGIPTKQLLCPHLAGEIEGFGTPAPRFGQNGNNQEQQHHLLDPSARGGKGRQYDVTIYSIVKFFEECRLSNPNLIDSIAYKVPKTDEVVVCLNPVIVEKSTYVVSTKTNCGSLRLEKPIRVMRSDWVVLEYYDLEGNLRRSERLYGHHGGYTVQHEVDHNRGVLITDLGGEIGS